MKKILIPLFMLNTVTIYSQTNLVPNPSFEIFNACPDTFSINGSGISAADNWYNPTTYTPDYYNPCDSTFIITGDTNDINRGVPYNIEGVQFARTGVAYAGIITMYSPNNREYIQAALIDTLISGQSYFVSFYVSTGDSSPYAANNIGAYFSQTPISSASSLYLSYLPQVSNNPQSNPLTDKIGWTEVSGTFIAQGGEKYITVGNFDDDASTDTTTIPPPLPPWRNYSYHYIDDVSVSLLTGINEINLNTDNIIVYPNPSSGIFNIQITEENIKELTIYNSMGELVLSFDNSKTYNIDIDLSRFSKGLYFLKIRSKDFIFYKQLLLNN